MSNMQTPTAMVDVQGLADTRRIAINRVGIKSIRHPVKVLIGEAERIGPDERAEVKRLFSEIKHDLRPMVNFLKFTMQALRNEEAPSPGERIDYPAILRAVTTHPQLADELRNFAALGRDFTASDSTARSMLDKVFTQVVKGGYLFLLDRDREVYAFTGKLDFLLEAIEFLMANEQIADEAPDDQPEQMRML